MKKILLLISWLLVASIVHAQDVSMDFIPFHNPGYDNVLFRSKILQQRDGDLVAETIIIIPGGQMDIIILGNTFYKVSPSCLQFTDSLFVADSIPPKHLFAQDPRGEGNLRVNIEQDGYGGMNLRISHFSDDNLLINHDEDVVVPLFDSIAYDATDSYMVDSQGDLIVKFYTEHGDENYVCHIARYGLDGTLKHITELPESQNFLGTMGEFESTPKQYYQWKKNEDENLLVYVLDSMFQVKNYHVVNHVLRDVFYEQNHMQVYEQFVFQDSNLNSTFVVFDDGDVLAAAPYSSDSGWVQNYQENGAAVARYELRTMQRKALAYFNDWPGPTTESKIMCLQKTSNGNVYLVYQEFDASSTRHMVAVKMDRDLNVLWRRYCYEPQSLKAEPVMAWYSGLLNDDDGNETGVYIAGLSRDNQTHHGGLFFFFLTDGDITSVEEQGILVRPYMFYPNPAQDQLRLQYSPDVQPKQIELYDLQGRLVRSQGNAFETFNLGKLPIGTYTLRVAMEDGQVFSDKVVKE